MTVYYQIACQIGKHLLISVVIVARGKCLCAFMHKRCAEVHSNLSSILPAQYMFHLPFDYPLFSLSNQ